jgi:hypothetical protein
MLQKLEILHLYKITLNHYYLLSGLYHQMKNYHTVEPVPKCNGKMEERDKIDTPTLMV